MSLLKNIKSLLSDTVLYGLSSIITQLAGLFLVPYYTKEFSPEEYGIIALFAMISSFLSPILSLGLDSALFRYFSMSRSIFLRNRLFTSAFFVKIIFVTICTLILFPLKGLLNEYIFNNTISNELYYVFLASIFVNNIYSLAFVILRVDRRVKQIVFANMVGLVISLTLSIWLVLILKIGIIGVLMASLISSSIQGFIFILLIKSNIKLKMFGVNKIKLLFNYGIPLIPHKLIAEFLSLMVLFLINNSLGLIIAGLYAVAKKFAKPLSFIVSMVQTAWSPYKFDIHKNEENPALIFKDLISIYWIALISLWSLLSLTSPILVKYLVDHRYWEAIPFIPFIMFVPVATGFKFTVSTGFELSKDQKQASKISFYTLILTLVIIYFSFDFYKPYNFILTQIISSIFFGVYIYTKAKKIILIPYPFKLIVSFLTVTVFIVICAYQFNSNYLTTLTLLFIQSIISVLTVLKISGSNKFLNLLKLKKQT
jgi:O-antigen/teichoic acid export membrane protein